MSWSTFLRMPTLHARQTRPNQAASNQVLSGVAEANTTHPAPPTIQAPAGSIPRAETQAAAAKAAIVVLSTILQAIDRRARNKAAIHGLRRRLAQLSRYLDNASIAVPQFLGDELISLLQDTSNKLGGSDRRDLRHQFITQVIDRCSNKLDEFLSEYASAAQKQVEDDLRKISEQVQQLQTLATMNPHGIIKFHCLTLKDAVGDEHRIPLEFCTSFQQLSLLLHVLFTPTPDSDGARIQRPYMEQGQYNLYIDDGTRVTRLTAHREWSRLGAETKVIMKCEEPLLCELPKDLSQCICKSSENPIGQGGYGDIWKCSLTYDSQIISESKVVSVAVKVSRSLPDSELECDMKSIQREMGIWRLLRHSHVVPFLGIADDFMPSRISLVSSWQEKGTLTSLLKDNHDMNYKDRLLLLHDIANGLSYLHSVKVVHGDLTGSNVLIDADGCARLTDFGLSFVVDASEGMTYLALTTRQPGAIRWAAPELVAVDDPPFPLIFWSDIYSYGCIALQALSGRLPWSEIKHDHVIIVKLSQGCLPQRPDSLPILEEHWDFILRCLTVHQQSRPLATEVLKWIDDVLLSGGNYPSRSQDTTAPDNPDS